jgi:N-carbamoylputrescine amidase
VGHEAPEGGPGIEFWGQSFFCAPSGQILKKADSSTETVLLCDLDLALMEEQRTHWPFLRDRRIDAYGDLTKRYIDSD